MEISIESEEIRLGNLERLSRQAIEKNREKYKSLPYESGMDKIIEMRRNKVPWIEIFKIINSVYKLNLNKSEEVAKTEAIKMSKQVGRYLKRKNTRKENEQS